MCSGQARDTILNNPNMLSHMECTVCGIKYFFHKDSIAPSVSFHQNDNRLSMCFMSILSKFLSINAIITFKVS